ncbi:hypothetical protein LR48_Vigan05g110100 [Vigna angularis]|uniref:Uncharacterized protein n=1 Tax=Phaseolus angularis TaxID=3914 RepID=A0A0L9ULS6_PHAAN|nr:hypothetical protein LR48_Vigan05g110100 [Vigna angularis]
MDKKTQPHIRNIFCVYCMPRKQLVNLMVTTRNMTSNMVVKEVDIQPNLIEIKRNLKNQMKEMQMKYEEELRTLCTKNTITKRREEPCRTVHEGSSRAKKDHSFVAITQPMQTKRHEKPCRTIHEGSLGANKDHSSVAIVNMVRMLPFTPRIMETSLLYKWTILVFPKYDDSTDPYEHLRMLMNQMAIYTLNSFATFRSKFGAQFATNRPHQLMSIALVNVRQEKDESL